MRLSSISCLLGAATLSNLPSTAVVDAKAILGVDLGSLYMKVALVQRNSPLEIVTNLHSKRKTEVMVLFDQGTRFYGADANSMVARKPLFTPTAMGLMLGRDYDHPTVKVLAERHYPITPSYNDTRSGVCISIDGQPFTPEELVAMVLTHAKDITENYEGGGAKTNDCVLTVPSFFTQHERRALLDAAALADLNVLSLIDENTAAALHFGIDRIDEEPQHIIFYNMGASALQVSLVRYFSYDKMESKFSTKGKPVGAFEVLSKSWDSTLGGSAFDARIVDHMADEFNAQWAAKRGHSADDASKDVRTNPRAMAKLRVQATKVKHVLSANSDMPVYIDALHDDVAYSAHISRATFEELCHDLLVRASAPIRAVLEAGNVTLADLNGLELIGGGMRIPRVQEEIQKVLGDDLDLGMHINSDESMALGAAFHGANVSTAFRVRHVGMADVNPFPISITLNDLAAEEEEEEKEGEEKTGWFGGKKKGGDDKKKEGSDEDATAEAADDSAEKKEESAEKKEAAADESAEEEDADVWSKHATIFKSHGRIGVKKSIAFSHDKDVDCSVDYEESDLLPPGTGHAIERYNVTGITAFAKEMGEKGLAKPKVSLQFELSSSGITKLVKAEAVVEEIVTVTEEVEVDDDDEEGVDAAADATTEDAAKDGDEAKEGDEKKDEDEKATTEDEKKDDAAAADEKKDDAAEADTKEGEEKNETDADAKEADGKKDKKKKKKKKTKTVEKEKKKVHRRPLKVTTYHVGRVQPYSSVTMTESKAKLQGLALADKDRMMLEESKNKVESYVYYIKNALIDDEEAINAVTNEEQRAAVKKLADDAEEWMYDDGYAADLPTYEDKYAEISMPMEVIKARVAEVTARPEAVKALNKKLGKIEKLMEEWKESMPQVTDEERDDVLGQVANVREWISINEEKLAAQDAWETPVFFSAEVPAQTADLETSIKTLSKKPKPKPVVVEEEKNETDADADADAGVDADADAGVDADAEADKKEDGGEEKKEEGAAEAEAEGEEKKEEAAAGEDAAEDKEL